MVINQTEPIPFLSRRDYILKLVNITPTGIE
jgi:hypothetical protein